MTRTYTLLVTLTGREPADLQALAQRIAADLETGTAAGAPYESAAVDAFAGDLVRQTGANAVEQAKALHRDLRA